MGTVCPRHRTALSLNEPMSVDISVIVAIAVASVACVFDLATRRIPNVLTLGAAACGFSFHIYASGGPGARYAGLGWTLGLLMFFVPFALRGLGGGDVKLMAALGAWLGPRDVFWAALYTGVAGGVLAVALALYTGYLRTALTNVRALLLHWRVAGLSPLPDLTLERSRAPRLCYAVPIAIGTLVALWLR